MLSLVCVCILRCLCLFQLTWFQYPVYRFWRKNTAFFGPHTCGGVDLNRNFDAFWTGVCPSACALQLELEHKPINCHSALLYNTVLQSLCAFRYYVTCLYRHKGIFANGMYIGDGYVAMVTCIQCVCCHAHCMHCCHCL